jgi:hypothetical protein
MSLTSTMHTVAPFVAGESKPLSGQRLARILFKSGAKKGDAQFPSVCVSLPQIDPEHVEANLSRLLPFIGDMLEGAQDRLIKSLYVNSGGTLAHVTDSDVSVDALIAFLESESEGTRLTKEKAEQWFAATLADNVTVMLAEKNGLDMTDPRIVQSVAGFKGLFGVLAGGKQILNTKQLDNLEKALALLGESDDISAVLERKIRDMRAPKEKKEIQVLDL